MANTFNIPTRNIPQSVATAALNITKSFAIQGVGQAVYFAGMPNAQPDDDRQLPPSKLLGNNVFSNLSIAGTAGTDGRSIPELNFETVLFNVQGVKNIVETPIQGKRGEVVEYIGQGNYRVNIKGVIAGNNGVYPDRRDEFNGVNNVTNLIRMCELDVELDVNSWFLNQFGITKLVIYDFNIPQMEGEYSTQTFEIFAKSEEDFIIDL